MGGCESTNDTRQSLYHALELGFIISKNTSLCLNIPLNITTFVDAFTFALLIIILVFKPTGLFGEKATDKV